MTVSGTGYAPHVVLRQSARWLPADTDTPISLFLGMCRDRHGILLESAEVDGRWGRYSLLACDFLLQAACRNGRLTLAVDAPELEPFRALEGTDFVEGLRQLMRGLHLERPPRTDLPPITRVLYGYFGYGVAGLLAPKLQSSIPVKDAEAALALPGTLLVFDHLYNRLCQISLGGHRDVEGVRGCGTDFSLPAVDEDSVSALPGEQGYMAAVEDIRKKLRQGEAIQVVPSCRFSAPFAGDPFALYRRMRRCNASPYMFFLDMPGITLLGSSPEVMVKCTENKLRLSPIAGTRKRGADDTEDAALAADLREDPKERAEHTMLVDLGRNDLGRIARPGTVRVERLMEVERFSHVMHLTSRVTAQIREDLDVLDVLAATFPAGTVSGAPKMRAMELIAATEQAARGPYAGCVGWFGLDHDSVNLDTGIIIRSMWVRDGMVHWQAGGGIVFDSDPVAEWNEVRNKSAVMRAVLDASGEDHVPARR